MFQPVVENRKKLLHVLEGERESLEARDGRLRKLVGQISTQKFTDVFLREAHFDASFFEPSGERFEDFQIDFFVVIFLIWASLVIVVVAVIVVVFVVVFVDAVVDRESIGRR